MTRIKTTLNLYLKHYLTLMACIKENLILYLQKYLFTG